MLTLGIDKLHASRLLTVEEKPFKRLTKRLLAQASPIQSFYSRLPTPPAEDTSAIDEPTLEDVSTQKFIDDLHRFRADVILDFAAFDSSLLRIQFLRASNTKECDRYAAERVQIEETAQNVRSNTAELRVQLEEARRVMEVRKGYDVLAEGMREMSNREELGSNIEKLSAEIEELEREGNELDGNWVERREGVGRVVDEGARLRRLVRGEPEVEVGVEIPTEDGEGMPEIEMDGQEGRSNVGTPRQDDGGLTPMPVMQDSGGMTPRSVVHDAGVTNEAAGMAAEDRGNGDLDDTKMDGDGEAPVSAPRPDQEGLVSERPPEQMDTR